MGRRDHNGKSSGLSSDPLNKPQQGQLLKPHFGGHRGSCLARELMEDFLQGEDNPRDSPIYFQTATQQV